jgi:hypothetical protein
MSFQISAAKLTLLENNIYFNDREFVKEYETIADYLIAHFDADIDNFREYCSEKQLLEYDNLKAAEQVDFEYSIKEYIRENFNHKLSQ